MTYRRAAISCMMAVAICATTFSMSGVASGTAAQPTPSVHPCPGLQHATCGSIIVPWYWGLPDNGGGTITVHFRI